VSVLVVDEHPVVGVKDFLHCSNKAANCTSEMNTQERTKKKEQIRKKKNYLKHWLGKGKLSKIY